ncbi:MAG: hypothetical protein RLZZ216_2582 [Cyanobacteriota bacterium]
MGLDARHCFSSPCRPSPACRPAARPTTPSPTASRAPRLNSRSCARPWPPPPTTPICTSSCNNSRDPCSAPPTLPSPCPWSSRRLRSSRPSWAPCWIRPPCRSAARREVSQPRTSLLLLPDLLRNALTSRALALSFAALARRLGSDRSLLQELQSAWRRSRLGGSGRRSGSADADDLHELGRADRDS